MTNRKSWIIVAVDGQAASGKGTISRRVAASLNLAYLDTGKLYRALTYYLVSKRRKRLYARDRDAFLVYLRERRPSDEELQSEFISRHTPDIASQHWARGLLLEVQRDFARKPLDSYAGAILDGRDIGTVVCPDADAKLFIVADVGTRARRRREQLAAAGAHLDLSKIRTDLEFRDQKDSERAAAPLKPAPDALLLDTTQLTIDAAVKKAIEAIKTRIGQGRA